MTPTEKAKDLFNKYFGYVEAYSSDQQSENAKKCALICVEECQVNSIGLPTYWYWNEVKTEIKKL